MKEITLEEAEKLAKENKLRFIRRKQLSSPMEKAINKTSSKTQNITCKLDYESKAIYCNYVGREIKKGEVVKTKKIRNSLYDYDKDNNLLGIETLNAVKIY